MAVTRKTVVKGAGAVTIRRHTDDRIMWLSLNSRILFSKTTTEGDAVQGFNVDGDLVDLATAGSELSFTLELTSKKNTRNMNELMLDSIYVADTAIEVPWAESHTVTANTVTLRASTSPLSPKVSYLDGAKLTVGAGIPAAAGQVQDNGNGTFTFHADDNGKIVVIAFTEASGSVFTQGGDNHQAVGDVEIFFHQVSGTSSLANKVGADVLWLPKCSLGGETELEFSNEVQDKGVTFTALVPDTPAGWSLPYQLIRDFEVDNRNA